MAVVWHLPGGTGPGQIDPSFQDHNPADAATNPDRYVVFHFHTEHIATVAGVQRPGIYAVVAFHGQRYGGGNWPRIDGNDDGGRNRRAAILNCDPQSPTVYWYPGQFTNDEIASWPSRASVLTRFMNYMFAQGILTADTFTAPTQGQLELSDPDHCTRRYFEWGTYRRSRQFGPNGAAARGGNGANPPPTGGDNEQDNDGV